MKVHAIFYNRHEHQTESQFFNNKADAILYGIVNDLHLITYTEEIDNGEHE